MTGLTERVRVFLADHRLNQIYRRVYRTPDGERLIHDLLRECGILENPLEPGQPDVTNMNIGRQSIGLYVSQRLRMGEKELLELAAKSGDDEISAALESVRSTI
jgi:hypothetical protein